MMIVVKSINPLKFRGHQHDLFFICLVFVLIAIYFVCVSVDLLKVKYDISINKPISKSNKSISINKFISINERHVDPLKQTLFINCLLYLRGSVCVLLYKEAAINTLTA